MIEQLIINYGTEFSIVLRVISCLFVLVFLIPLQIQEAAVKNGLRLLRYCLLACGLILLVINLASLYFLFDLFINNVPQKFTNAFLQVLNATAYFALALLANFMYRLSFTEEQKEFHRQVSELEN